MRTRTLAFDGRAGVDGDRLLGALIASGADPGVLAALDALDAEISVQEGSRGGVATTEATVRGPDDADAGSADRDDGGDVPDATTARAAVAAALDRLDALDLPARVAADARATVDLIEAATAAVAGADRGDDDGNRLPSPFPDGPGAAVARVAGAALLLADPDPDGVVTTHVAVGRGSVDRAGRTLPTPTPTVVELAGGADWRVRGTPRRTELTTPVGAAVLAHHADGVDALPGGDPVASGHGGGDRPVPDESDDRPGTLRAVVVENGDLRREPIAVLETTVDDVPPEVLGGLRERLPGARSVTVLPLTGKKSRPGHLVRVVVAPEDARRVARRLAAETGTLGVRATGVDHRYVPDRTVESVTLDLPESDAGDRATVAVKVATDDAGAVLDVSAEYDDAAAVADEYDLPVRAVMRRAERAYRDRDGPDADRR